jgi:SpoIID/LytB domain protein
VRDASGEVVQVPAGELKLGPKLMLGAGKERRARVGPLVVKPGAGAPLGVGDKGYRGEFRISSDGKALQVINVVGLEAYLLGVVPGEMPKDWPLEALKAQAVAARTYAISSLVKDKEFDLYASPRSQVYYGTSSEAPGTTRAVQETRGTILEFEGRPALTLYFSSSGGRTRSALDTFGLDLPYLRPVKDPWDAVQTNPNHRWEASLWSGKQLMTALKLKSRVTDLVTTLGTDGRPTTVRFTTASGAASELSARDVRTLLALRSTSFRLGVLRLFPPRAPASAAGVVPLEGVARDVEEPLLERQEPDGTWVRAKRIVPRPDGSFSVVVRPGARTTYRLTGAGLPGPSLTLTAAGAPA